MGCSNAAAPVATSLEPASDVGVTTSASPTAVPTMVVDTLGPGAHLSSEPGVHAVSVEAGGLTRWFQLFIPEGYDGTTPVPLLLAFHGGDGASRPFLENRSDLLDQATQSTFLIAFGQGYNTSSTRTGGATWNAAHCCGDAYNDDVDDIVFVGAMIDALRQSLAIDERRIYASGFSNGAMLVHRLAAEVPGWFAAVSVNSGTIGGNHDLQSLLEVVVPTEPVPIIIIHGEADTRVSCGGGLSSGVVVRRDISFAESVRLWVESNGCENSPIRIVAQGAKGRVRVDNYEGCVAGADVVAVSVENHGHAWPSVGAAGFNGTAQMVTFLLEHEVR